MSTYKSQIELNLRLKSIRKDWHLSQKEMAERLNIATSTYQYYERGERDVPSEALYILTTYKVSVDWLLTGNGEIHIKEESEESSGTVDMELLGRIIGRVENWLDSGSKRLPPEKKARLISLLYERFAETGQEVNDRTVVSYLKLVA